MINFLEKNKYPLLLILILSSLLRLLFLSSDPSILLDSGQVGDEGYWIYNARSLVLFNQFSLDKFFHDLAAAPIFSLFSLLSFSIFGVGFWQARLISAISGILIVFFTYKIGLGFNKKIALLSALLVSTNILLLLHNRLAVGESLSYLFLTISFYFLINKKSPIISSLFLLLGVFSKTTSFLYIPSFLLVLISQYPNSKNFLIKNLKTLTLLSILILTFFLTYLLIFGKEIISIYETFGSWYAPTNISELSQNITNFFIHPFWGSPFIFSLVIFSFINLINFVTDTKQNHIKKSLFLWILGFCFLGTLISRLTNARLLGLIVPISILAADLILNPKLFKINTPNFKSFQNINKKIQLLIIFILFIPLSLGTTKVILAVTKRLTGNENVVNNLWSLSIVTLLVYFFIYYLNRRLVFLSLFRFNLLILIFLPILSLNFLLNGYFYTFFQIPKSTHTVIFTLIIFLVFVTYSYISKFNLKKLLYILLPIHFFFTLLGLSTIYLNPSYNLSQASRKLGNIAQNSSVIGFYAHELAIENSIQPIYWAPRLANIESVNSDYQKYNPKILLVNQIFDNKEEALTPWPNTADLNNKIKYINTLDLTRQFKGIKREFRINVYQIIN